MGKVTKIMLILFSMAQMSKSIDYSLKLASENEASLDVKFIIEEKIPRTLSSLVMYTGFLGEKMGEDIEKTLLEEYYNRARKVLTEIKKRAKESDIDYDTEIVKNGSLTYCYQEIKNNNIDYLIINYTRDRFISEQVLDYYLEDFLSDLEIPYELFYDGSKKMG
ncbi:hypothetical protein Hore_17360 [Halothermothrix orenii H 168]|uniref:Uncharacterized protein n=1 Tax=Halothermothrix orenii (strain H 168 / OCM 544 / DSM 9562) TaxID=373903 RepID=B8CYW6_HALOH|nr:hypothetical protein Hore_17360 [Halothermothrix orenii H 168]